MITSPTQVTDDLKHKQQTTYDHYTSRISNLQKYGIGGMEQSSFIAFSNQGGAHGLDRLNNLDDASPLDVTMPSQINH